MSRLVVELPGDAALLLLPGGNDLVEQAGAHLGMAPPLGDVVGHDGVPHEQTLPVAEGGDEDLGPKPAPVLPPAPALVDRAALGSGPLENLRGPALASLIGHVEE